jgi:hypothetical protein
MPIVLAAIRAGSNLGRLDIILPTFHELSLYESSLHEPSFT